MRLRLPHAGIRPLWVARAVFPCRVGLRWARSTLWQRAHRLDFRDSLGFETAMIHSLLSLPLVTDRPDEPVWQGLRPVDGWDQATAAPEPDAPQGEYAPIARSASDG